MAVQQNKKSKSKKGMRRAHHHVAVPALVLCSCGAATTPHAICPSCGSYRGRSYKENKTAEA
jgi:large subunit ribosomal protein L32